MAYMAAATAATGLLSSGAQVGAGFMGQPQMSSGDQVRSDFQPNLDLVNAAANYDAMNLLGFGDIGNIPSPTQRLVGQIQTLQLDEKTKRRGLLGLSQLFNGEEVTPQLEQYIDAVISRVGVSRGDLSTLIERDVSFKQQQERLSEFSGIQADTIMERARTARAASQLLGGAASAATGGGLTPLQQRIRDSLSRNLDDAEETARLRARFGGTNPAQELMGIYNARGDLDLRSIEQSLLLASGLTQGLGGGLGYGQNAQANSNNANLGAASIAANQSAAANALQANANSESSTALANGFAGAGAALANAGVNAAAIYSYNNRAPATTGVGSYINTGNAVDQAAMGQTAPPGGGVLLY